jgi:hypothetical protein
MYPFDKSGGKSRQQAIVAPYCGLGTKDSRLDSHQALQEFAGWTGSVERMQVLQLLNHIGDSTLKPAKITIMGNAEKRGSFEKASQLRFSVESVSKINAMIARQISGVSYHLEGTKRASTQRTSWRRWTRSRCRSWTRQTRRANGELDEEKTYSPKEYFSCRMHRGSLL